MANLGKAQMEVPIMLEKLSSFADVRIEMMQAMLNASIVSQEAFKALAALVEDAEGETKDDEAWEAYKAQFVEEEEEAADKDAEPTT
jgi:hypothetical protein